MEKVKNFSDFNKSIMEGGAAIKSSRNIKESEVTKTIEDIKERLIPILDLDVFKDGEDYIFIGSAGRKKNPEDESGDIDLGFNGKIYSQKNGVSLKESSGVLYQFLQKELPALLGFEPEINHLKGLNMVSVGWPIAGDRNNGFVQLDLIPLENMNWAKFIYYSPDYKRDEIKWKSAHRNWLLSAALAAQKEILSQDDQGEVLDYRSPGLILPSGLYIRDKSFRGKIKPRVKNPYKIEGTESFITNDPQEFIDFALGKGYKPEDVKTFEQVFKIITSPNFVYKDKLPEIKKKFVELCNRTNLPIPPEIETIGETK
jgi:hypothetical protein